MSINNKKIGFIGAGNMASAMIRGIVGNNSHFPNHIVVYDIDKTKVELLEKELGIIAADHPLDVVSQCQMIIPAVKPNYIAEVMEDIRDHLTQDHLLISIAAGINLAKLKEWAQNRCMVVRTMPNTPALVGEGMTAICLDPEIPTNLFNEVKELFSSFGMVEEVEEKDINAVTAISGSSPAYVFMFIEALADGGVLMGLPRQQSLRMAAQAVFGSAKMVLETNTHPGMLKDMVCSPGGTTIEAVYTLEQNHFRGAIIDAVKKCAEKGVQMGKDKKE